MKKWLLPVLAIALGGTAVIVVWSPRPGPAPAAAATPAAADTTEIRRTDLKTSVSLTGSLGYGVPVAFSGRKTGTLTWLPAAGAVVDRGQRLYAVDALPVPLLLGETPLYRKLDRTVTPGPDVKELIANLRALGYRNAGSGSEFGAGTEAALKRWQKANGLEETGALDVGDAVVLPAKVRIGSVKAQPGAAAATELFDYTGVTKAVTAELDPAKVDVGAVKPGGKVGVTLPDGTRAGGTITTISAAPAGDAGAGQPKQSATVTLDDQAAVSGTDSGPVQVEIVTATRPGVLAVPVNALLSLAEGGYALQVVKDGKTTLIGVTPGMFADNMVEISGAGLVAGMRVVTAS